MYLIRILIRDKQDDGFIFHRHLHWPIGCRRHHHLETYLVSADHKSLLNIWIYFRQIRRIRRISGKEKYVELVLMFALEARSSLKRLEDVIGTKIPLTFISITIRPHHSDLNVKFLGSKVCRATRPASQIKLQSGLFY